MANMSDNFFGENGEVFVNQAGEWVKIGDVDILSIDVSDCDTEEEKDEKIRSIVGATFQTEIHFVGEDAVDVYERVYYMWLAHHFPTLHWN